MSPRASTPKLPATAAGRQLRRRLAVVAGVCLVAPLLGFLGLFAARQLDAQRSLSQVQAADAAEARAARSLPAAAGALSAALAERLDDPQGVWLQVDGQGELVAPRLPAPGAGPLPSPELAQALAAGDELEFVLLDGPAALLHYRALLERARPEDRAPILLELLGSYARADDWPAVEAVAQELLAGHARGAWRLGREGYLHAHLARIDAAQALGSTLDLEPALRELELTAAWEGRGFQGAGFFRERLRAAGARLTPGWTRLAEAVAAASRPLVPRDQTLRWVPGLDAWFAAQERDGGRRIGLFEPQTLLRQALALPGARAAIRDPLGRPVWTTPHPLEGEPERVLVWREPPLRGFSLELSSADEAGLERAYAQQRRALFALVALAGAVLVLATWVLLRQAGKAVDLARARTDFVAGVTHDLKTPLALIRLYGETLELHPEQDLERRKTFAGVVVREADRLHDLVENVLQLTRGEVAAPRLDATDLGATVAAAVDEVGLPPQPRFEVVQELDPELPPVTHAPSAVRQIVRNLLGNALKYCPQGGTLTVSLRAEGRVAVLAVEDEGPGIAPGDRERVFEPFLRLDAKGASAPGSGLGLAIVRRLAALHGGSARAVAGAAGARIEVRLPLARG